METATDDSYYPILGCMFQAGVIGNNYWPIEYIRRKCKWTEYAKKHSIKKSLKKILKYLESLGLVDMHGKTRKPVASLTSEGVAVARDFLGV